MLIKYLVNMYFDEFIHCAEFYKITLENNHCVIRYADTYQPIIKSMYEYFNRHISHKGIYVRAPGSTDVYVLCGNVIRWEKATADTYPWSEYILDKIRPLDYLRGYVRIPVYEDDRFFNAVYRCITGKEYKR